MIEARIQSGRVEVQEPIPEEWEGQRVKIALLTPDDPLPNLEESLLALYALGPTEFEPGEREEMTRALDELDQAGKQAMAKIITQR